MARFQKFTLCVCILAFSTFSFGASKNSLQMVIIDPGHGGRDPGATIKDKSSKNAVMEKNINLEVAKELNRLIREKLHSVEVVLTRDQDVFVSLGERTKLANQFLGHRAIFVSIHTNSHTQQDRPIQGVEVFYHYASNSTIANFRLSEYRYRLPDLISKDPKLEGSLQRLMDTKVKEDSKNLAEFVGKGIQMASREPIRQIAPSNFYVVSYGIVPSILVEVGFISNEKLKNKAYLKRLAKGILLGILGYMVYEKEV